MGSIEGKNLLKLIRKEIDKERKEANKKAEAKETRQEAYKRTQEKELDLMR